MTYLSQRLFAEALGTACLLTSIVGSGIMAESLTKDVGVALLASTLVIGATLVVLITTLGPVSGAHFNPAVTFAFFIRKSIGWKEAGLYILVQIGAAFLGVYAAHFMFEQETLQLSDHARTGIGQWSSEVVATFGLVFVIFMSIRFRPEAAAWVVGLYITSACWYTASTSFANPAVTIARAFTNTFSGIDPSHTPAFIAAQFVGAALAVGCAVFLEPPEISDD